MLKLDNCSDLTVENAYIITILGNSLSEELSSRCQTSCSQIGQPYTIWEAFDGTNNSTIKIPEHLKNQNWLSWIKQYDYELSISEVACYLSHISLWARCLDIDKPIVILEHDAIMLKPYTNHIGYNQIGYLGCYEQQVQGWKVSPTPIFAAKGNNYKFMLRAHAYAIDPHSAKNLMASTLKYGINESLDVSIRADVFNIIQPGLFAFDLPAKQTTIANRKKKIDGSER